MPCLVNVSGPMEGSAEKHGVIGCTLGERGTLEINLKYIEQSKSTNIRQIIYEPSEARAVLQRAV